MDNMFTGVPQMIGNLVALKVVSDVAYKVAKTPTRPRTRNVKVIKRSRY